MLQMKEELELKYTKDLEHKEQQSKLMLSMQEKLRGDLEYKLQENIQELEDAQNQREQEINDLRLK